MSVRSLIATNLGRLTHWALHDVLHRSGSQLPGRVALGIDPGFLSHVRAKVAHGLVVVCGTNGKTTTTNLVAATLEERGDVVLCNRDGANMAAGVASALLPLRRADWAVLEADELSTIYILPHLRPTYLVLLNLFRDQLDRAGEIDHVQDVIASALEQSPETTLLVCGDDPLSMGVAERARERGTRVLAFGVSEDLGLPTDRVPEARFCQRCGAELDYAYRTYAQLGAFRCPTCGFGRPTLDYAARGVTVDREGVSFALVKKRGRAERRVRADFGGVYMVYNLLAAATVSECAGVDAACLQRALDAYDPHNGRLQTFVVDGREVVLNLAKNPTGLNQNISLLLADTRPKAVCVLINDNYNDGRDVSWLWDVDFERLATDAQVVRVLAGGSRAHDLQVRLKYAGIPARCVEGAADALSSVQDLPAGQPLYMLTNYSALEPARCELEKAGGPHGRT